MSRSPEALSVRYRVSPIWVIVLLGLGLASFVPMFQTTWGFLLIPVGLGLLYWGVVLLVNRTTLSLNREELRSWNSPLPMLWQKPPLTIPVDQIAGFKMKRLVYQGESGPSYTYELLICQKERAPVVLKSDSSLEALVALRCELEKILREG